MSATPTAAPARLRSVLFAPAVREDLVLKTPATGTDAIVIDCEDATPPAAKDEVRPRVRELSSRLAADGVAVFVRVNAVATSWFVDDVHGALGDGIAGVVVPKVDELAHLDRVAATLRDAGRDDLGVLAGLETVRGVVDARELLGHPQVTSAYFGAEDLIADLGGRRTSDNTEVLYARSRVALAARLAGVALLDQIVANFADDARFTTEAEQAQALGMVGKMCIHPRQVTLANAAFTPTAEEVDRARRLLATYEEGVAAGSAAVAFEGQMVDGPLVAQARQVLEAADPPAS